MYYPLLRARQFELIALRELAIEGITQGVIIPILEPVKEKDNNLNLAFKVFQEKGQTAYLILNPSVGDRAGDDTDYLDYLHKLEPGTYLPAFRYRSNGEYIRWCIDRYSLENCMIICQNDVNVSNPDFTVLAEMKAVTSLNVEDPGRNRSLSRYITGLNKDFIRLDDPFERQLRNSDYLSIDEHLFSEENLYYADENFSGFSDYTVLPSDFIEGGSTPRAVVIHLTYLKDGGQIWIRHFTSVTNDSIVNVQGKFAEAAEKAVDYCRTNGLTNSALQELCDFYDEAHYPGLGTVKKISIKNHLLIVAKFLKGI